MESSRKPVFGIGLAAAGLVLALAAASASAQDGAGAPPPRAPTATSPAPPASPPPPEVRFQPFADNASVALGLLDQAQRTVRIAHYNIRNAAFYDKLEELRGRGVAVEIVVDAKNARQPWNTLDDRFEAAGFSFFRHENTNHPYAIMHHKFTVIDDAVVMTGSYNWNSTAQHTNDENMLVFRDAALAAEYTREFDELVGRRPEEAGSRIPKGAPVEVLFSPEDRPNLEIKRLIGAATRSVRVAMFSLKDWGVAYALRDAARKPGVRVDVVTEKKQADTTGVDEMLAADGVNVIVGANRSSDFSAMHLKYCVIDEEIVVTGACNWTRTAFRESNEDVLIIRDAALARAHTDNFAGLVARYAPDRYDPADFGLSRAAAALHVVLTHPRTALGDEVRLVGSHPALGAWDPRAGVPVRTDEEVFPRWTGFARLPAGERVDYKYVTITAAGEVFWEVGPNRVIEIDAAGTDAVRTDRYRFPDDPPEVIELRASPGLSGALDGADEGGDGD